MQAFNLRKISLLLALLMLVPLQGHSTEHQDDCTRGEPYPVFSKNQPEIQSHKFTLISTHEASEQIRLTTGEFIQISHSGCEYYNVTFRFESKKLLQGKPSIDVVFKEAAFWLRKMEQLKADTVFKLGLAANTLEKAIGKSGNEGVKEGFPVEGDGIDFLQTQVLIKNYGQNGSVGFIEVSLFKGPL